MISYTESIEGLTPDRLQGFFVGWPNPPAPEIHLRVLQSSHHVVLAVDEETNNVVGFITAISDEVLFSHIPLVEVLPDYQRRGIGSELLRRMLEKLKGLYAVDLLCDPHLRPFYARFGMMEVTGMSRKDFGDRSGE